VKAVFALALAAVAAGPLVPSVAAAIVRPYVRVALGGNQLNMDAIDSNIAANETTMRDWSGYPVELKRTGLAFGPEASAGLWLFPALRVGATYSSQTSSVQNDVWIDHTTIGYHYVDHMEFRVQEVGAEVMLRMERLAGLSLGGQVAQGRAQFSERFEESDFWSQYHMQGTAERTRLTWTAFLAIDQTNDQGFVGYVRAGYRFRDYGSLPGSVTESDGSTTVSRDAVTVPMDFSGFFMSVGIGYDFFRP
jgi:hypothetical protein